MSDLLLINGDLVVNGYGDISLVPSDNDDIVQTANNNILLRIGNNKYHPELGNNVYNTRVKRSDTGLDRIAQECKIAIMNGDPRVVDIPMIEASIEDGGKCKIKYALTVDDSDFDIYGDAHVDIYTNSIGGEDNGIV